MLRPNIGFDMLKSFMLIKKSVWNVKINLRDIFTEFIFEFAPDLQEQFPQSLVSVHKNKFRKLPKNLII